MNKEQTTATIRVRIAPSPTGNLHIGTARAALFNYLFAKNKKGKFVLRIEDTDLERSDKKYEQDIFDGLKWLGIEADESPEKGGPYAPYRQSERIGLYKGYIEQLLRDGRAFYCFHSEKELLEEREQLLLAKKPPVHWCEYRTLNPDEAKTLTETKEDFIIRFKTPAGKKIVFDDIIRGTLSFESDLLGDISIAKRVDVPLYNFAVVVDDFEMEISHVIRGEDHIPNTPKQLLFIEALGFPTPQYAHLPLILGSDRSKISKRHGATSIAEYRERGYLPEALFNFIALLGWNPGDDREIFSQKELKNQFSLARVQKSGAVFDIQKLDWMNGEYIRSTPLAVLTKLAAPFLEKSGLLRFSTPNPHLSKDEYIERVVALEQPRLKKLSEIAERVEFFFKEPRYDADLLRWKKMTNEEIHASLESSERLIADISKFDLQNIEKAFLEDIGDGDKGARLWPLRAALSGKKASPGPFEIMATLGKEESLRRIQSALGKL